jgi:molybdenum cofactor cytidylyltransferase
VVLNNDDGARRVMLRYPAHGQEVDDAGVLLDVDTPPDLDLLRQHVGKPPLVQQVAR